MRPDTPLKLSAASSRHAGGLLDTVRGRITRGRSLAANRWAARRMVLATAYACQDQPTELKDAADLERFRIDLSRRLASGEALIVTFEARGRAVYLGLNGQLAFVHVTPIPDSPPYVITVGDPDRPGVIEFMLHGEHSTEIEARHLVPVSDAWRAVSEFLLSGNLLSSLTWTEV